MLMLPWRHQLPTPVGPVSHARTAPELSARLRGLSRAQAARVPLSEYEFPAAKVANVQSQLERLVAKNYYLHQSAREAYRGYLLSYNSHQMKDAFNVHTLDLASVARSFGFTNPPKVLAPPPHAHPVPPLRPLAAIWPCRLCDGTPGNASEAVGCCGWQCRLA